MNHRKENSKVPMNPAPPFDFERVAILAAPTNPLATGRNLNVDYLCWNCGAVVVRGLYPRQFTLDILFQCADCTAFNQMPNTEIEAEPLTHPMNATLRRYSSGLRVPLDPEASMVLGQFIALWGQLDEVLLVCIAALRGIDLTHAAELLASNPSGPRHSHFKKALAHCKDKEVVDRGKRLKKKIDKLLGKRNAIVHGVLGSAQTPSGGQEPAWLHASQGIIVPVKDLFTIAADTSNAAYEATVILFKVMGRPAPPRGHPDTLPILRFGPGVPNLPETWLELAIQPSDARGSESEEEG